MISAIVLARAGVDVTILEKQPRVGTKILATGNGRCNLSNINLSREKYHSSYRDDLFMPIKLYGLGKTINFFRDVGIVPLVEDNKVYPLSEQASSIVDALRFEIERLGVELVTDCLVNSIECRGSNFLLNNEYEADAVIVATGGLAGVREDTTMYNILAGLGHTIIPLKPTLVHVKSKSAYCKMLQGTRVKANATIFVQDKFVRAEYGEVLFTEDGLSGPAIFQLSRIASLNKCKINLDLCPQLSVEAIINNIFLRIKVDTSLEQLFVGWLNKKVSVAIIKAANVGKLSRLTQDLEYPDVLALATTLKNFSFEVSGTRPFKFAQATIGGVSLKNVDLSTMKSKLVNNLYIAGEILDVDGDCGGYNLQWAWSTGMLAANSIISSNA